MTAATHSNSKNNHLCFSFSEILAQQQDEQARQDPVKVAASDGVEIAITVYEPPVVAKEQQTTSSTALVFYHGGGAHSGAGYQNLARGIAKNFGTTVYLPDLRGHGASGGPRGDAPSKEQVWRDVDTVLGFVADHMKQNQKQNKQTSKIFLGGHSSGGGLVVNYSTAKEEAGSKTETPSLVGVDGYVLVSPELGYKSGTAKPGRFDFASVNMPAFVANGIFGILGHYRAVKFRYPQEILEADEGMVAFNTVNMAKAITPESPREQMQAMGKANSENSGNDKNTEPTSGKPIGLWVGSEDELFVPEKVTDFIPKRDNDNNTGEVVPGKNHLGILVGIHERIGQWIIKQN
eukprot:CAMPEP_0172318312 /NCGR_PEP_ID=MMETSP1058-20130122/34509_1 /TAXON_ID=83371 /ORGANISM="Detonula confervacea, Strain CCMP 353" /LENGTH=347 /DNA_ID=CAMNT_0013033115 /DNA_START=24 /DNA_END=1067 /DNA_ORIENTATION=-